MATKKTTTTKKTATKKKSTSAAAKTTKKTTATKVTKTAKTTKRSVAAKSTKVAAVSDVKKAVQTKASATRKPMDRFKNLNMWNWAMTVFHAAQGVAVILLSQDRLFPVTTNFLTVDTIKDTGAEPVLVPAVRHLFDVNLAWVVAAFFFMSALAHLSVATWYRKKYEHNLGHGLNKARWYEYAISASTMMLGISMLAGVSDLSTLVLILGATSVMNLLGLVMEVHNQHTPKTNWLSFIVGTKAGIMPWIAVGLYLWGANQYGEGDIPTFVYYIYGSMFVFFSSFAVNMWLQYRKKGKWAEYLYGEKTYMVLSLVAKSLLAWQVFAGALRP